MRQQAAAAVLAAVPDIIEAMIEAAKAGHHLAAKFVFEFAGIAALGGDDEVVKREISLAELLLQKMDAATEGPSPAESAPGESGIQTRSGKVNLLI